MIDRFRWYEKVAIYAAMAVFMAFILAPFVEAFVVSTRPIDALFRIPYRFVTEDMSFQAYRDMWVSVPNLPRYIFNSFFISCAVTALALICIVPAAYSFSRFEYRFRDGLLIGFLAINMIGPAVLIIPLYKLMLVARPAQHLFRHDHPRRRLLRAHRHLPDALLHAAHSQGAGRGGLCRWGRAALHALAGDPAGGAARHRSSSPSPPSSPPTPSNSSSR